MSIFDISIVLVDKCFNILLFKNKEEKKFMLPTGKIELVDLMSENPVISTIERELKERFGSYSPSFSPHKKYICNETINIFATCDHIPIDKFESNTKFSSCKLENFFNLVCDQKRSCNVNMQTIISLKKLKNDEIYIASRNNKFNLIPSSAIGSTTLSFSTIKQVSKFEYNYNDPCNRKSRKKAKKNYDETQTNPLTRSKSGSIFPLSCTECYGESFQLLPGNKIECKICDITN
jgi:hypothetical protein